MIAKTLSSNNNYQIGIICRVFLLLKRKKVYNVVAL